MHPKHTRSVRLGGPYLIDIWSWLWRYHAFLQLCLTIFNATMLQHCKCFCFSCSNQAECEELQRRVESLGNENRSLREELQKVSEECEKLTSENNSIKVNSLTGHFAFSSIIMLWCNVHVVMLQPQFVSSDNIAVYRKSWNGCAGQKQLLTLNNSPILLSW